MEIDRRPSRREQRSLGVTMLALCGLGALAGFAVRGEWIGFSIVLGISVALSVVEWTIKRRDESMR